MKPSTALRSEAAKVKGLGSAKSGVHHWLMQRISALALIPLIIWAVSNFIASMVGDHAPGIEELFISPLHTLLGVLCIAAAFYHGTLGIAVVLEDYIRCNITRNGLIIGLRLLALLSAAAGILGILRLHFIGV